MQLDQSRTGKLWDTFTKRYNILLKHMGNEFNFNKML